MDLYSVWPFFIGLAVLVAVAATPVFRVADQPPSDRAGRMLSLDGVRGFLALAVYFHHAMIKHGELEFGLWQLPPSRFYSLIGDAGVSMFFMITGYLFWSRLVEEQGRPRWTQLYLGRVFRIAPLYLCVIAAMFAVVLVETGFELRVSRGVLAEQVMRWLSLGLVYGNDVNGIRAERIVAGVTWTLRWEWLFYFSMPLLAVAARRSGWQRPAVMAGLAAAVSLQLAGSDAAGKAVLFLIGMACVSLPKPAVTPGLRDRVASCVLLGLVAAAVTMPPGLSALASSACLGGAFYLVIAGCSVFGILNTRSARRLGDVSYGIYLLQGLVLTLVVAPLCRWSGALGQPALYWVLVIGGAVGLIGVATLAHHWIERPGIRLGRAAGRLVRRPAFSAGFLDLGEPEWSPEPRRG